MIKMQPEMTEILKINHFLSLLRKIALQTFRNINKANRQTLEDILAVFRRKYAKPESKATAKHTWHRLVFDPNTMKLPDFSEELNQGAKKAFGENTQAMNDSLLYAKLPPKLKQSVNMTRLENASYEEIVTHLELAFFLLALIQLLLATTAKKSDTSRTTVENSKERRNNAAMTGGIQKEFPKCPICDKTNDPAERCWKGAEGHLKPKNLKLEDTTVADTSTSQEDAKNKQTTSILKNPKN